MGAKTEAEVSSKEDIKHLQVTLAQRDDAVRVLEDRCARLLEAMPAAVVVTDAAGLILEANSKAVQLASSNQVDTVRGRPVHDVFRHSQIVNHEVNGSDRAIPAPGNSEERLCYVFQESAVGRSAEQARSYQGSQDDTIAPLRSIAARTARRTSRSARAAGRALHGPAEVEAAVGPQPYELRR